MSGLAEPIRLSFVLAGISFKDTTPLTDPQFNDRKLALHPYAPDAGGLPILVFDGKVCCQSRAILRYVGRIAQHDGAFLYPTEDPIRVHNRKGEDGGSTRFFSGDLQAFT